jgi:hypothetical protein
VNCRPGVERLEIIEVFLGYGISREAGKVLSIASILRILWSE